MGRHQRIGFILGTRPEIIKLAPVIRGCADRGLGPSIFHSGQHYSESLDQVFLNQLDLPEIDRNLNVGSNSPGRQIGEMIAGFEDILKSTELDIILVQGDTNTVLAGAIAADRTDTSLAHVEAGLRSFDTSMPEETNRKIADHLSDLLFPPTKAAANRLRSEAIPSSKIHVTGNTIVDAVQDHLQAARNYSTAHEDYDLEKNMYGVMTAHRQENVDDPEKFSSLLSGVSSAADRVGIEFVYPIHPRAQKNIDRYDISIPDNITIIPPLDYLDFLALEDGARIIATDSGGIQEEACILRVPCVTLRENTERPETLEVGANILVGTDGESIISGILEMLRSDCTWSNPFGDGTASSQILDIISENEC